MLRESSETHEQSVNLEAIMSGEKAGDISSATELIGYAEAIVDVSKTDKGVASVKVARDRLQTVAGAEAVVDAAGVVANFQRMVRIADSTGIVLGPWEESSRELRLQLGIDEFK